MFTKPIVFYRGENSAYEFIKAILKEYKHCRKVMNKHFNGNLIMREKEEHLFQQSNSCWIRKKLIDNDEEKVRDKFDVKTNVIPNGLQKYIAFFLNKNLVFVDSMQFMNSSLDKLIKTCQMEILST